MKAYGTTAISYLRGREGTSVYYGEPRKKYSIRRTYVIPEITAANHLRGREMANLGRQWRRTHEGYRANAAIYILRYNAQHPPSIETNQNPNQFFPLFVKMMFAFKKINPLSVNLETGTLEDWNTIDERISVIYYAAETNFLPMVVPDDDLDTKWQL